MVNHCIIAILLLLTGFLLFFLPQHDIDAIFLLGFGFFVGLPVASRGQLSAPVQGREQTRPVFNPSAAVPRPTEEQFRPALIGNRPGTIQAPPRQFVQAPPPPPRTQTTVGAPQQRQPIVSSQLPVKPQLGRPIVSGNPANPAPANFAPAPVSNIPQSNRAKPIQPECNLFSEGICLDVRNYPT